MRLDEWQKYIEAQFLDELETVVAPPQRMEQPSAEAADAEHTALPDTTIAEFTLRDEIDVHSQTAVNSQAIVSLLPLTPPPVADTVPTSPPVAAEIRPPVAAEIRPEFVTGLNALSELDITIPDFDSYLPASHPAARAVPAVPPSADMLPQHSRQEPDVEPIHSTSNRTTSNRTTGNRSSQEPGSAAPRSWPTSGVPASAPIPAEPESDRLAALPVAAQTAREAAVNADDTAGDLLALRRNPRSRARHARNVRPDNVPSGLSAGELWAKVPKHVQTLLALERLEEEQEVAQFSYKRPFQEKRHELIERLLDPILSLEDTARLLNVCPTTVRRYTNKGILTYYRKEPDRSGKSAPIQNAVADDDTNPSNSKETRQRRFRLSDILAFLETQQAALEADRRAEVDGALRKRRQNALQESVQADTGNA